MPLAALLLFLAVTWSASIAQACPSCAAFDPTIAGPANDSLASRSVMAGVELRLRGFTVGDVDVEERVLGLRVRVAPLPRVALLAHWELAHQELKGRNLSELRRYSTGDPYVGARAVLFRDTWVAPQHLLLADAGTSIPLGHRRDEPRMPAARDAELGLGHWQGRVGLRYRGSWGRVIFRTHLGLRAARAASIVQLSAAGLYQPSAHASLEAGLSHDWSPGNDDDTASFAHVGFWLRGGPLLFGTRIAIPLHGASGPILQLDCWFNV